ncbi:MFS transporter [Vibrio sp. T187]|uniref:MFS transporter n=1 Tax=Vibrio TaxID=662 RepID=UPI0010C9FA63|nr:MULTISPECIES: MFS transporter [Vibrio]MBW3694937.1 MFS transporter [Vibrio sp. T187]
MIELGSSKYKQVTYSLAIGSFIIFCNLYLFQPILPHMAEHFQVSETQINWLFASTTLALSLSLVPWAVSSESFGRKPVILFGMFAIPVVGITMLLTDSLLMLVAARAVMGVAIAAFAAVAVAYMVEELTPQAFSMAIGGYIAANSLGGIFGRVAGGILTDYFSWKAAVLFFVLFSFSGALFVLFKLPEQRHFKPQKGLFFHHNRAVLKHIANKNIWLAMLIGGANFALFVNLYSVMGFRLVAQPHNLPVALASLIFLCYLAGTLSSKLSGFWAKKHNPLLGMALGSVISMFGMWVSAFEYMPTMLLGLILISFGAFFTHTLAYAWVSQKATTAKATATALYLVHYYVGGSLGGFVLLYCWQAFQWEGVIWGGMLFYTAIFLLLHSLYRLTNISLETATSSH